MIVGVDGSDEAGYALDWALREAASLDAPLTVVHAWEPTWHDGPRAAGADVPADVAAERLERVRAWLDAARARAGEPAARVDATAHAPRGDAAATLLRLSQDAGPADALVVGRTGRGRLGRLVLGSVPSAVVQHATVPVTVVRGPGLGPGRPVVVGVDGSPTSVHAVRHAAAVALRTGAALEVLLCWQITSLAPLPDSWGWAPPIDDYERFAAVRLDEVLDTAGVGLPDDRVVRSVRHVTPPKGVIEASSHAGRLVLGNRGAGGFDRLLVGSVTRHAVEYAHCPVTVVRPPHATHPSGERPDSSENR
ncbi:universal stress protein [Cellulosimicrobium arenosum]|uniref:universal stress protein n=1 Tax=Cellulosimicrobium arenosum TaxID=2708133 RepID=UPI0030CA282F